MTTPLIGAPELPTGQRIAETTVNEMARWLEQGARFFTVKDRDATAPPGSPSDGDAYLVASGATGAWAGQDGRIAFRLSSAWEFIAVTEGMGLWVADENRLLIATSSSSFQEVRYTASVRTVTGTSGQTEASDANGIVRFTNGAPVQFTVRALADAGIQVGDFIELHQFGAGGVTIVADDGVTLVARDNLAETAGQYAVAGLRHIATDVWVLTGDLVEGAGS